MPNWRQKALIFDCLEYSLRVRVEKQARDRRKRIFRPSGIGHLMLNEKSKKRCFFHILDMDMLDMESVLYTRHY